MDSIKHSETSDWKDMAALAGPALLGAATGVVLGDIVDRKARAPLAIGLAVLGLSALAPNFVSMIANRISGPETRRGSQRRLRGILEGGAVGMQELGVDEDEYLGV